MTPIDPAHVDEGWWVVRWTNLIVDNYHAVYVFREHGLRKVSFIATDDPLTIAEVVARDWTFLRKLNLEDLSHGAG